MPEWFSTRNLKILAAGLIIGSLVVFTCFAIWCKKRRTGTYIVDPGYTRNRVYFVRFNAPANDQPRVPLSSNPHGESRTVVQPEPHPSSSVSTIPPGVNQSVVQPQQHGSKKVMHGYNFGKSVIMMDPEYLQEKYNNHNFNEGQTGGVLKLIQFTKKANILDSYLVDASAKTVLPALNDPKSGATQATVALIQAMLDLRVVALCRYTFHAKSHPQLIALIPHKDDETGVLYMRSVKLPFSDDMRSLKFPKFTFEEDEVDANRPTVAQLSAVDDLIDCMQLPETDISSLVQGGMSDPKLQMQCHFLKSLVLHPNDTMENHSIRTNKILDDIMAPKRKVEAENSELFQKLGRDYNLQPIEKTKRDRVTVEPEDLQAMISEWTVKKEQMVDETEDPSPKKKKKLGGGSGVKKMTRREEVQMELDQDGGPGRVCSKMLKMISNTCKFQSSGALSGFFDLLVNELNVIRSVFVEKKRCDEFNELLKKLKDEDDFEPFASVLCADKCYKPIDSSEVVSSEFSEEEAAEFWEEE